VDEEDGGFEALTEVEIAAVMILRLFLSALPVLLNFPFSVLY
jgi:hypothetical protein